MSIETQPETGKKTGLDTVERSPIEDLELFLGYLQTSSDPKYRMLYAEEVLSAAARLALATGLSAERVITATEIQTWIKKGGIK